MNRNAYMRGNAPYQMRNNMNSQCGCRQEKDIENRPCDRMQDRAADNRPCDRMQDRAMENRPCDRMQDRSIENRPCERQESRSECRDEWKQNVPTGNRRQLLAYIDEVSFGAYEAVLFLDAHPDCREAMQYFQEHNEKRNFALKEYTRLYGPLNLTNIGTDCDMSWEWANQPWPWEGGNC